MDVVFRVLTIVDAFSRLSPGVLIEPSISGERVARFVDEVGAVHGYPKAITVDNDPQFVSNGGPTSAASKSTSFNGRLRGECLNANWFESLAHAREVIEE